MSADTGGAAFPSHDPEGYERSCGHSCNSSHVDGMTLLDYFAGQALMGMCVDDGDARFDEWNVDGIAGHAYRIAAAMLTERARRTEK